jgi:hypothetical protein
LGLFALFSSSSRSYRGDLPLGRHNHNNLSVLNNKQFLSKSLRTTSAGSNRQTPKTIYLGSFVQHHDITLFETVTTITTFRNHQNALE